MNGRKVPFFAIRLGGPTCLQAQSPHINGSSLLKSVNRGAGDRDSRRVFYRTSSKSPDCSARWARGAFTRKQLHALGALLGAFSQGSEIKKMR
jgi:hypothetical protein